MNLLFLHGFAADRSVWKKYNLTCGSAKFPTIKFDKNNLPTFKHIADNSILIGWSMGGMVALHLLKTFTSQIKGLVLISSAPTYLSSPFFPAGKTPEQFKEFKEGLEKKDPRTLKNFQKRLFSQDEIKHGYLRSFRREIAPHIHLEQSQLLRGLQFLSSFKPENLPHTDIPVTIIHGTEDSSIHISAIESWKQFFPNAEIISCNAGHCIPYVHKDLVISSICEMVRTLS